MKTRRVEAAAGDANEHILSAAASFPFNKGQRPVLCNAWYRGKLCQLLRGHSGAHQTFDEAHGATVCW